MESYVDDICRAPNVQHMHVYELITGNKCMRVPLNGDLQGSATERGMHLVNVVHVAHLVLF